MQHPLNLRAIYIRESQTAIGEHFDPLVAGQQLQGWHSASPGGARLVEVKISDADKVVHSLEFTTNFEFVYRSPQPGQPPPPETVEANESSLAEFEGVPLAARVSASIVASFVISDGVAPPDPNEIVKLAQTTVLHASWPYWREFCQTAFHRMQMPQTLIPLLVISAVAPTVPDIQDPPVAQEPTPLGRVRKGATKPKK